MKLNLKKTHILLSSISSGVTRTGKSKTKKEVRDAVNVVSFDPRTMPGVKRKWFDINIHICAHRKNISGTEGGSLSKLSNTEIAGSIGEIRFVRYHP